MKYEKNDALDQLIEAAIAEMPDKEGEEFESIDDSEDEIGDRVDRKVEKLLSDQSKKITGIKYRQRILSSAALVALVTVCIVWMAIMNTFGSLPNFSIESSETSTERTTSHSSQNPSQNTSSSAIETINPIKNRFNPTDEKRAIHTVSASCTDGLTIEVTLHGYQTQSLHKAFYVKNDEYFAVDVKITNTSEAPVYQFLSTDCGESTVPHNHEIGFNLSCGNYPLSSSSFGFVCEEKPGVWILEPGETYTWSLKFAPGTESYSDFDLPADGNDQSVGIRLYNDAIYDYGTHIFDGNIFFSYRKTNEFKQNDQTVSVPLSIEVIRITEK